MKHFNFNIGKFLRVTIILGIFCAGFGFAWSLSTIKIIGIIDLCISYGIIFMLPYDNEHKEKKKNN